MALHFNYADVADYKELHEEQRGWDITNGLIWLSITTGIGDYSEKNLPEILFRINVWEKLNGAFLTYDTGPQFMTAEMLKRRVGLHTNAGNETRAAWKKRQVDGWLKDEFKKVERILSKSMEEVN
jgi:hypothetical protein